MRFAPRTSENSLKGGDSASETLPPNFVGPPRESAALALDLLAESLRIGQWSGHGGLGYELALDLRDVHLHRLPPEWVGKAMAAQLEEIGLSGRTIVCRRIGGRARLNVLGLELDTLKLAMAEPDVELDVTGQVKGNILRPKNLVIDAHAEASGDLATFATFASGPFLARHVGESAGLSGRARFRGQVTGNLDRLLETLKVDGAVELENPKFREWAADHVALEGAWRAPSSEGGAGELSLTRGEIVEREGARAPGTPGQGGKIAIGAFKMPLDGKHPVVVPLTLEHAHIHWLAAPGIAKIFALSFRASGAVQATINPQAGSKWSVATLLKLEVVDFLLDNQKQFEAKPEHKVLEVPKLQVEGNASVDPTGVTIDGVDVILPNTKFHATGKIGFVTGFDLHATGHVDFKDIGRIAENDIRGQGSLDVKVHGPSQRVIIDFDTDLKDASYLNLNLGDLQGRITWDDDPDHLIFTAVNAQNGSTRYQGDGMIDVRGGTIDLSFAIPQGDVRDLTEIFSHLNEGIWWYPRTMNGPVSGSVRVTGGLSTKDLIVLAKLSGSHWEYLGERFQQVSLSGGYDRGKFEILDLKAMKRLGTVSGHIWVDAQDRFDWEFEGHALTLSDLDHIASLDVPIRGRIAAKSAGSGALGRISSETEISLTDAAIHGSGLPPSQLTIRAENGVTTLKGSALGGSGILDLTYDFKDGGKSELHAEAHRLDFSPILLLLNPKEVEDAALAGYVTGSAHLAFRSGELERATGRLQLAEYRLARADAAFELAQPVDVRIQDGVFELHELALKGPNGEATLEMRGKPSGIEGEVGGQIDLSVLEFLTPTIEHANGVADLDFGIGGVLKEPTLTGKARLEGASAQVAALDSPFENVSGSFGVRQNIVTVDDLEADLAGGRVRGDGTVTLFASRYPSIDLHGTLSGNRLPVFPFQFVHVKGTLDVKGDAPPYQVSGAVVVDSALSKTPMLGGGGAQAQGGLKAVQYSPPPSARMRGGESFFKLDVAAKADRGVLVQDDLFDAEFKGAVTIVNTLEEPRIVGTAEMLPGGKLTFKDRVFQIQSFTANFDNPTVIDPAFSLTANTEVNRVKIQLFATGRVSDRKMELTSNPSMPESEIVSLLAVGLTSDDAKRLGANQTIMEQGEGMSLLLNTLDFNRDVKDKTGIEIQLDEGVSSQIGTSVSRPATVTEATAAPMIVLKRKLGNNVDLSARSTVGVGTLNEKEVNAEVHVTPGFSVIGVWDQQETLDPEGTQTNSTYGSYGVDFKVMKRFK